nr:hypothetical protein Iba_chr09aCG7890 [Ipomoea batatas]
MLWGHPRLVHFSFPKSLRVSAIHTPTDIPGMGITQSSMIFQILSLSETHSFLSAISYVINHDRLKSINSQEESKLWNGGRLFPRGTVRDIDSGHLDLIPLTNGANLLQDLVLPTLDGCASNLDPTMSSSSA